MIAIFEIIALHSPSMSLCHPFTAMSPTHSIQSSSSTVGQHTAPTKQKTNIGQQSAEHDPQKILATHMLLAKQKNPDAIYLVGAALLQIDLREGNTNHTGALGWLTQAHELGSLKASCQLGEFYFAKHDYKTALVYFNVINKELFNCNDVPRSALQARVNYLTGQIYHRLDGNINRAESYFIACGQQGDPEGYYFLGTHFEGTKDMDKAQKYYWEAAQLAITKGAPHQKAEESFQRLVDASTMPSQASTFNSIDTQKAKL